MIRDLRNQKRIILKNRLGSNKLHSASRLVDHLSAGQNLARHVIQALIKVCFTVA